LSYVLPILENLRGKKAFKGKFGAKPMVLIVIPTRELAIQVTNVFNTTKYNDTEFRTISVYGGTDIRSQIYDLSKGCDIVIATPGRLIDFLDKKITNLKRVTYLVLDEADRMLDMGFEP
jgi:superfamily II DNA/RNA helicase